MELRVASWNLWGDSRWDERELSVVRLLGRIAPDLLAVQELSPTSAMALDRMLGSHRRAVPGSVGEPPVNIWFDADRLICTGSGSAAIDGVDGGRGATWARLRGDGGAPTFLALCAHLTWDDYPDPSVGPAIRDRQADRLASLIESLQEVSEAVVVLADFNDERRGFDALTNVGLVDCHERLQRRNEPTQPVPEYEPFETMPRTVDRILINGAVRVLDAAVPRLPSDVPPPSDHWPVVATIRISSDRRTVQ